MTPDHPPRPVGQTNPSPEGMTLRDLTRSLRRRWALILGVAFATVAAAAVGTALLPPAYEGEVVLRLAKSESSGSLLESLNPIAKLGLPSMSDEEIDTDVAVLQSRRIAEVVVDSLHLHVALASPRVARDSLLRVTRAGEDAVPAVYELSRQSDGAYAVRVLESDLPVRAPARVARGQALQAGNVSFTLAPAGLAAPDRIVVEVSAFHDAVEDLLDEMTIERQRGTRLVGVTYRSGDRLLAAAVPEVATSAFTRYKIGSDRSESRSKVRVLRDQVATYEADLREAEERLRQYREATQIIEPKSQAEAQVKRLAAIQGERDAQRVERESLADLLEQIRLGSPDADDTRLYRQLATFPSFIMNAGVQGMLEALIELETEKAELRVRRTEADPDVEGLTRRIRDLEDQLYRFGTGYLRSVDNQIASADRVVEGFGAEIRAVPAKEAEFLRLAREQKLLEEVYGFLQARLKEAEIEEAVELGNVRVIDAARIPREPVSPDPLLNLSLAAVLGLLLGVTVAVGRGVTDRKVWNAWDVESASGVPVLGAIPGLRTGSGAARSFGRLGSTGEAPAPALLNVGDPAGAVSEAYRLLRTRVHPYSRQQKAQVLLVSSPLGADGKSVTAANLALSLAQQGTRVVLVDADLRAGTLHESLGAAEHPGLMQILLGEAAVEDALQRVESGRPGAPLFFLPHGGSPPHPVELLASAPMRELVERLKQEHEVVLLDAPPMLSVADASVLATAADAALLVARAGSTDRDSLQDAVRELRTLGVNVGGVVLSEAADEGWRIGIPFRGVQQGNGRRPSGV